MHIRPLDLTNDDEVHAYYVAMHAAATAENPDRPVWTEQVMIGHLREPTKDMLVEPWAVFDDSESSTLLGGGLVFFPQLDNLDKAYCGVEIAPQHQRRGAGGAIVEHLIERSKAHGRTTILLESQFAFERREDHGYRRFAERHGFRLASVEICRRMPLPVPEEQIQAWIDEAAPHHTDYRIETFEEIPDDLLPSVCYVVNQLALDAPTGDIEFEAEQITPEIRREFDARFKKSGGSKLETVAIDTSGQAVAVTTIGIMDEEDDKVHQWATIVNREHRGHRLGLAVKAANLRAVQRAYPERTVVYTTNSEHNDNMVAINEKMGFVPVELFVEFQRKLDA
jgi:RimJ/RimL family protein N-acetyltransferase